MAESEARVEVEVDQARKLTHAPKVGHLDSLSFIIPTTTTMTVASTSKPKVSPLSKPSELPQIALILPPASPVLLRSSCAPLIRRRLPSRAVRFLDGIGRADTSERRLLALGIEGSANKLGAGIVAHEPSSTGATLVTVLSNVRHTYITPPGEGFLPSDTARHHREWVVRVIREAVKKAGVRMSDIDVIAFTKGEWECAWLGESHAVRVARGWLPPTRSRRVGLLPRSLTRQVLEWEHHCKSARSSRVPSRYCTPSRLWV